MAEVDAHEDNFAMPVLHQAAGFRQHVLGIAAGKRRADVRDDAIAALHRAAVLHLDVGAMPPPETGNAGRDIDQPAAGEQFRQAPLVAEDLDDAGQGGHFRGGAAGVAAHDDDFRLRVPPRNWRMSLRLFASPSAVTLHVLTMHKSIASPGAASRYPSRRRPSRTYSVSY